MTSIFIRTILIYLILSIMMKLMGKRQIGELEANELVSTLLISEIAALPLSDTDIPLLPAVIPILFIAALEVMISALKNKSRAVKRIIEGEPVYIVNKGKLKQSVLAENRISVNELLSEMRLAGIGSLSDVEYGILEPNGRISLIKKSENIPYSIPLIIDTVIEDENLAEAGKTRIWLNSQLVERSITADDVFLLTLDDSGTINIIRKEK